MTLQDLTPEQLARRVVVCAANRHLSGRIVAGARHWDDVMRSNIIVNGMRPPGWDEQGFIDQWGIWMDRVEAWHVANAAHQIKHLNPSSIGVLYSEDLY